MALSDIWGLGGFLEAKDRAARQEQQNLAMIAQAQGLAKVDREQQLEAQARQAAQSGDPMSLLKLGTPQAAQIANAMLTAKQHEIALAEAQKKRDFFSPENQARYMTPAQPAVPAVNQGANEMGDEAVNTTAQPAVQPKMDFSSFLKSAAMNGIVPAEAYANHLAQREQAAQNAKALQEERKAKLEQRKYEIEAKLADSQLARDDRNALRREMLNVQLQLGNQNAALRRDQMDIMQGQRTDQRIQTLSHYLDKAGLPVANGVVTAAENSLKTVPKLAEYVSGPKAALPDLMVPEEIRKGRQDIQKLFNITLKDRSGAAVTEGEFNRLKQEFGSGVFKTPAQIEYAVKQAKELIKQHYQGIAAGFPADVRKAYSENISELGGKPVDGNGGGSNGAGLPSVDAINAELARRQQGKP